MADNKILTFEQPASFYYRSAQRMIDSGSYIGALSSMRKAVNLEPENAEYILGLSEVLTEIGKYEESNRLLLTMLEKQQEPDPDSLFCLGCNFMGLGDAEKAKESFEKYIQFCPDGDFRDDVEEFLYYFDIEEEYLEDVTEDEAERLAEKGKQYIDAGEYQKAVSALEKVTPLSEDLLYAQNNLALAHYCLKNTDQAIKVTKKVLARYKNNVHANCNMAVFLYELGDEAAEDYLKSAMNARPLSLEDKYKIAITLCELKKDKQAILFLKDVLEVLPYDEKLIFYLAVACFNTKRYKEALRLLNDVKKLDYPGVVAEFHIKKINYVIDNPGKFSRMDYVYQVSANEARKKIKYLNECLLLPKESFRELWETGTEFYNAVLWGLEYGDETIKKAIATMVASFEDDKAEQLLRDFIFKSKQPDSVKNDIFLLLKQMDAEEPYVANIGGQVVEVNVGAYDDMEEDAAEKYTELFQLIDETIGEHYTENIKQSASKVVRRFLELGERNIQECVRETAAAILYIAISDVGGSELVADLCKMLGADLAATYMIIKKIREKGYENDEN